jgi:uncharacterized protein (DUF4415 family)
MVPTWITQRSKLVTSVWDELQMAGCSWWPTHFERVTAMPRKSASSARGGPAAGNARRTTPKIDFSEIPEASPGQLRVMRRVGRPPLGDAPRQLIAIRVDASVLDQFRKQARRRRVGYQTLINEVLAQHARKEHA